MSIYDLYFTFGKPGTYLLDHPKRCVDRNVPEKFHEVVKKQGKVRKVKCLALDADDTMFFTWQSTDGDSCDWCNSSVDRKYPRLGKFLDEKKWADCMVTFGPDPGDFFVTCTDGCARWSVDVPDGLKDDPRTVKMAALGLNGAYVVLYTNGGYSYRCSNYPELDKILDDCDRGDVVFVAMNPHRANEFFIALAQNTVVIRASAICEQDVSLILQDYPDIKVITSDLIKPDTRISKLRGFAGWTRNYQSEFLKNLAASAGGGIIASAVSMSFACTVM